MEPKVFKMPLGNKELIIETGKLAQQTNGSCTVRYGDTMILGTAVMGREPRNIGFFPLMVNYQEKYYAAGMIKSPWFIKRETRPADDKILMGRVIDRTIRPLFPKGFQNDVQVMLTILSYDRENLHDMYAAIAASCALTISDAPFEGPTATVRVGMINGEFVLNPTQEELNKSDLDLIVSSTLENVVMIEAGANEVSEEKMLEAIAFGKKWAQKICRFIDDIRQEIGKEKIKFNPPEINPKIEELITSDYLNEISDILLTVSGKLNRNAKLQEIKNQVTQKLEDEKLTEEDLEKISEVFSGVVKKVVRKNILEKDVRMGGRKLDEIRKLFIEVGLLPRVHGSGLFQRGETQGLSTCTLGSPGDKQIIDGIEGESKKRYFHHYNFPPFSVGETSNRLFTGNREIGHGALAERALERVLPALDDFPYTIRTCTEILASNGSSSMAATCGSTLALMDAGVPIKKPVAGIAMGMMSDSEKGVFKILTDLQDEEDSGGDMDFKVAGTDDGITAIQMDIKLKGLTPEMFEQALEQGKKGRLEILNAMKTVISEPRAEMSEFAPRLTTLKINPDKIRNVIGKGGETINGIIDETGVQIDIEDDGTIIVTSADAAMSDKAIATIKSLTAEPEVGKIYKQVKVVKIMDFGAFVEFMPGNDGLVHISMITDKKRLNNPSEVLKEGQLVNVKLMEIDSQGRKRLSMIGISQD